MADKNNSVWVGNQGEQVAITREDVKIAVVTGLVIGIAALIIRAAAKAMVRARATP